MAQPRAGNTRSMSKSSSRSGQSQEQSPADAQTAASSTASRGGVFGMAMGVWKKATNKLFDLEAKIANQVSCTSREVACYMCIVLLVSVASIAFSCQSACNAARHNLTVVHE